MKTTFRFRAAGKKLFFLLCLVCCAQTSYALNPAKMLSQYKRVTFNTENGLSLNYVQSILQTRDGYLWLGTQEGLIRYNGASFKIYETANTPTLKSNYISTILEDSQGRLWVGTLKGLHLYQNGEFKVYSNADGLSSDLITALYEDGQENLWIGTGGGAINLMRDGKIVADESGPKLPPDARIRVIAGDASGNVWFGTSAGLFRLQNNQMRLFTTSDGLDNVSVRALYLDREKNFWVGTDEGLARLENETFASEARFRGKKIRSIKNDRSGALWVSGEFGISRISTNGNLETLENRKDAPGGVYDVLEDAEGSLWAATEGDGVWQFVDSKFVSMNSADGLISDIVYSFSQNSAGDVWISTEGGLSRYRGNAFDLKIEAGGQLPKVRPSAILTDAAGDLWIGSTKGLARWRDGNFVNFKGGEILAKKSIQALYQDAENNLWIGTGAGLYRFNERSGGGEIVEIFRIGAAATRQSQCLFDCRKLVGRYVGRNSKRFTLFEKRPGEDLHEQRRAFERYRNVALRRRRRCALDRNIQHRAEPIQRRKIYRRDSG